MNSNEAELKAILDELAELPKGNITYRVIRGKKRMYLQWYEDRKKQSRYIKASEEAQTLLMVRKREGLQTRLKELVEGAEDYVGAGASASVFREPEAVYGTGNYRTNVIVGGQLTGLCKAVDGYEARGCFGALKTYLDMDADGRVCLVYGLRRTGKTTLIMQAIALLPMDKTAYIKIMPTDTMDDLNADLRSLEKRGVKYVFIDEITLMSDFIDSASLLSDVYSMVGMKLVLSGTDSLGFALSLGDELYDRAYMVHTTFIPFREYSRLLQIHDVDEYIRYGGTLKAAEIETGDESLRDEGLSFSSEEASRKYIDTAISRNIQHSLLHYKDGGQFRHLQELYEAGELTGAINRIIEDMNHRFLMSVLTRDFVSHDLGSARQLSRKKAAMTGTKDILGDIDVATITKRLKDILEIRNKEEMAIGITPDHIREIREYLFMLDLIVDCPSYSIDSSSGIEHIIFSQPGMRYCQAQALTNLLMKDEAFSKFSAKERKKACDWILEEVRGRMLEEIVLLETNKVLPRGKKAFKLQFPVGEYDMVIWDEKELTCDLYEIKHSTEITGEQYRYLVDADMCAKTEFQYGDIVSRNVIYRGESTEVEGIRYINVVEYLEGLR